MANPKGNEASLRDSRFKAVWQSGSTRTIRVPVVLAETVLEYAHRLDDGIEPRDTMNKLVSDVEVFTPQFIDTSDSSDEVQQLKAEVERLQNELSNLQAATSPLENEPPEAADLLNKLKAKRKKATASLADIEVILEILKS
jgi:predicted RNase H-like nuclease (RuvC/YqgF family)